MTNNIFSLLLASIFSMFSSDNSNKISTSRPGVANPTSAVSHGMYQFEMGLNSDLNNNYSYPFLFRTGLTPYTEIQLSYNNSVSTGLLYGGINLIENIENSIIIMGTLSEDNNELINTDVYLPFSISYKLPIWGQIAGSFPIDGDPNYSYALAIGGNVNNKTNWFIESFGNLDTDNVGIDAGVSYLLSSNSQIDLSTGTLLNQSEIKFIELGFSFRLPN